MSDPARDDDQQVADLLKTTAEGYEPDRDRIRRRIRDEWAGPPGEPARRPAWLLPVAPAAALVLVIAGAIGIVNGRGPDHPPDVRVISPPRPTTSPAGVPGATGTPPSSPSSAATAAGVPGGSGTSTPGRSGASSPAASTPAPRQPALRVDVRDAAPGEDLSLPGTSRDWIAAGDRPGTEVIRRAHGGQIISGPHVTGNPTVSRSAGPFSVSWSGGLPDLIGSRSRTWLSVTGAADGPENAVRLEIPAQAGATDLVLYVGAAGADGFVEARRGEQGKVHRTELPSAPAAAGHVVRIRVPAGSPAAALVVRLVAGTGGTISLAAAVLH